jgi:hypothetical protein
VRHRLTLVDTPEGRFNGRLRVSEPVLDCGVNLIQLRTGSGCALQTVTAAARSALCMRRLTPLHSETLPILLVMREAGGARRRSRIASMTGGSHRTGHVGKQNLIHFCSIIPELAKLLLDHAYVSQNAAPAYGHGATLAGLPRRDSRGVRKRRQRVDAEPARSLLFT